MAALFLRLSLLFFLPFCSPAGQKRKVIAFFQESCASAAPNPCQQICTDIPSGGSYCQCQEGYTINNDGMTCSESQSKVKTSTNQAVSDKSRKAPGRDHASGHPGNEDNRVVLIKSVDLRKGLPALQSGNRRRLETESSVVLNRDPYNIPEGERYGSPSFNFIDIPEGGDHEDHDSDNQISLGERGITNLSRFINDERTTCDGIICQNNGTCAIVESHAVCLCPLGTDGPRCERTLEIKYPQFLGTGYLTVPRLLTSTHEFHISLEFKPESPNGLLLFSAQNDDARGDFISIVLEDGHVVFRFDCGSGPAIIKTPNRVQLADWNKLHILRLNMTGTVRLNSGLAVDGHSRGNLMGITFRLQLFVGGYSDMSLIAQRVNTSHQFVGCIQELVINAHKYDFKHKNTLFGDAEGGINIGECSEHVCDKVQCQNGGSCVAKSADEPVCLCPLGFHGRSCQKDSPVAIPYFTGHSYLEFPGLERTTLSHTEIMLVFRPNSLSGTLLYNSNTKRNRDHPTDFISLTLHNGYLEFRFDLGTGPAILRSPEPLALGQWHVLRAARTGLLGFLEVDRQKQQTGEAKGAYTQITLLDSLYLGGHPNFDQTLRRANLSGSFTGCIQKVRINKRDIDLMSQAVSGINVESCSHPCDGRPCLNGGECVPHMDTYICLCPIGFESSNCEYVQQPLPTKAQFGGFSYLAFKDKEITKRVSGNHMDLQMHIRPTGQSGLLFWSGEDLRSRTSQDFFALGFYNGSLQLRYNLGSGEAVLTYRHSNLFDGRWHFIRVQRNNQDAYLEIDHKGIVEARSPGTYTSLNTNKLVYLGGMPNIDEATRGKFNTGYSGCVGSLKLATDFDVSLLSQSFTGRNIGHCQPARNSN